MKLIADCGSTKIDWCVIDNGQLVKQIFTCGMNAIMLTEEEMAAQIEKELKAEVAEYAIDEVYFYGAGCISEEVCDNVRRAIAKSVPAKLIEVHTDLLAAARALCGRKPGIACILGTGSNSCYYDGEKIVDNVSPLGYILGDEGSGAVLGKLLVGDVLKKQIPEKLCEKFLKQYELDRLTIIQRVYKQPGANRFLASVTFFVRNIANYDNYKNLPVNFIGSIAHYYQDVLREAADAVDCHIGTIIKSPMAGLIEFHK